MRAEKNPPELPSTAGIKPQILSCNPPPDRPYLSRLRAVLPRYKGKKLLCGRRQPPPSLFISSGWEPEAEQVPNELRIRLAAFASNVWKNFKPKPYRSNLNHIQAAALQELRNNDDLIVFSTDKNLGPAIIERDEYVRRVLTDHLLHKETYRRLTEQEARGRLKAIQKIVENFIGRNLPPKDPNGTFIQRSMEKSLQNEPFSQFYITAKVHKEPWATRPIVAYSGSILHGLGRWVDRELQKFTPHLPFYIKSSAHFREMLVAERLPANAKLFTMDATSMYTNIVTDHALKTLSEYFAEESALCSALGVDASAVIQALSIIMNHNVFQFGDTFWLQLCGTAMGTPPACMYATLYFYLYEKKLVETYSNNVIFYRRLIDDGFGVWSKQPDDSTEDDNRRWSNFDRDTNKFGQLEWTISKRQTSVDFLDLTVEIKSTGEISTRLFEKAMNLYLYLPPTSAHPRGQLKSLVFGYIKRVEQSCSRDRDRVTAIRNLFRRLRHRGHSAASLRPIFAEALSLKPTVSPMNTAQTPAQDPPANTRPLYLHVAYNPANPRASILQQAFETELKNPPDSAPLARMPNHRGRAFGVDQMTVANHRPPNIGNILAPRKLYIPEDKPVSIVLTSDFMDQVRTAGTEPPP